MINTKSDRLIISLPQSKFFIAAGLKNMFGGCVYTKRVLIRKAEYVCYELRSRKSLRLLREALRFTRVPPELIALLNDGLARY